MNPPRTNVTVQKLDLEPSVIITPSASDGATATGPKKGSSSRLITLRKGKYVQKNTGSTTTTVTAKINKGQKRHALSSVPGKSNGSAASSSSSKNGKEMGTKNPNRFYYNSKTCLPIVDKNNAQDSDDDESGVEWLEGQLRNCINDFIDVTDDEKQFMNLWNIHIIRNRFMGDCQIDRCCSTFVEGQGKQLLEQNLYSTFVSHLATLHEFGLMSPEAVLNFVKRLQVKMFKA